MLWRPPRRSWCMHRILCTACNRNSTRSFERGHDGNILEEAYRGRYARQRLLNFWPESSCGYHAIKRFVCIIQVATIRQHLPFLIDLTATGRKSLSKLGDKTHAFVKKAVDIAAQHPDILPASHSVEDVRNSAELFQSMGTIRLALEQLSSQVYDT